MKHDSARQDRIHAHFARFGEVQAQAMELPVCANAKSLSQGDGCHQYPAQKFSRTSMKCPQNVEIKRQCGGLDGVPWASDFTENSMTTAMGFPWFFKMFSMPPISVSSWFRKSGTWSNSIPKPVFLKEITKTIYPISQFLSIHKQIPSGNLT